MARTRRKLLVGAGAAIAVGLAGCGGDGGGDTPTATETETEAEPTATATSTETATPAQQVVADEEVHLEQGHHQAYRVYYDTDFRLSYEFEVTSGPNIDVFVLQHQQYNRYDGGRIFDIAGETSDASSGSNELELSSATYHLVVDNTSAGDADPGSGMGQTPVDVQIQATSEPL